MKRLTENDKAFYRGFAVALGTVARDFNAPFYASQIAQVNGVTLEKLEAAGTDEYDLKDIRRELKRRARR